MNDYRCGCGERFPASLFGAWQAKLHAEDEGHRLRPAAPHGPRDMDRFTRPPVP